MRLNLEYGKTLHMLYHLKIIYILLYSNIDCKINQYGIDCFDMSRIKCVSARLILD